MRAEARSRAADSMDVSGFDWGSSEELSAAPPVAGSSSSISKGDSATRSRTAAAGCRWRICRAGGVSKGMLGSEHVQSVGDYFD
jgi:hypothetical protein